MLGETARDRALSFGPFRLLVSQRLLLEGGRPVRIGSRALDPPVALATRPSELVSMRELMEAGWPGTKVAETNLAVHINAARRAAPADHRIGIVSSAQTAPISRRCQTRRPPVRRGERARLAIAKR